MTKKYKRAPSDQISLLVVTFYPKTNSGAMNYLTSVLLGSPLLFKSARPTSARIISKGSFSPYPEWTKTFEGLRFFTICPSLWIKANTLRIVVAILAISLSVKYFLWAIYE